MKIRTIFLALFGLFAAFSLSAQTISIGVRGGYTLSELVLHEDDLAVDGEENVELDRDFKPLDGFHIGLDTRTAWGSRWALLLGVQYHQKGSKQPAFFPTGPSEGKYITNYVTVPLLAEFSIWKGLCVQAGAEAGYLVNAVLKVGGEKADLDDFGLYKNFDLGFAAGLEYRTERGFFAGLRQTWGIANIYDAVLIDTGGGTQEVEAHNRALQISAGYRYIW